MSNLEKTHSELKKLSEKDKEKISDKVWNDSEVQILKKWGEIAASYRLLHDRAFREFQVKSYGLTIPVIIMSTLSGTASFSISSFPESFQSYAPMVIGGINITVGIIQTITQFLRVNELTESHRSSSITYGKFARNIVTELSLPPNNRSYNGIDFVQMCRTEMDRMIEQSPIIPIHLLNSFDRNVDYKLITKPEVLSVSSIAVYEPSKEEKVSHLIAQAADKLQHLHKVEKTNVQKIQDKINNKVNPKQDEIPDEINEVLSKINIDNLDVAELNLEKINVEEKKFRDDELSTIKGNGVVSRLLKKEPAIIKPTTFSLLGKNKKDVEIKEVVTEVNKNDIQEEQTISLNINDTIDFSKLSEMNSDKV
jgi:hypothetical protein